MQADFSGSSILVTGAAGRLGRVVVRRLIDRGARVIAADNRDDGDVPREAHFVQGDVTHPQGVEQVFEAGGRVNGVIHTVGTWAGAPLTETSVEDFETIVMINLTSTFLVFREAARRWAAAGTGGNLVAIASRQGADAGAAEQPGYSASKAGVIRLVESTAAELGERGIRASAVAPSMILFGGEGAAAKGIAVDRLADMCIYLASGTGAASHTGTVVRMYGNG